MNGLALFPRLLDETQAGLFPRTGQGVLFAVQWTLLSPQLRPTDAD
jgi:hypothetical protein